MPATPRRRSPRRSSTSSGAGDGGTGGTGASESEKLDLKGIAFLVTAFIAAVGTLALTGNFGRIQRNEPEATSIALGLLILSGGFWIFASHLTKPIIFRGVAIFLAVAGFYIGLSAAVDTANDEPRPRIKATLSDDARKLTAEISASNMTFDDRLAIWIDGLTRKPEDQPYPLYRGYIGPDGDGNVNTTVTTFIPQQNFTDVGVKAFTNAKSDACDDRQIESPDPAARPGSGTGCVTVALVPAP